MSFFGINFTLLRQPARDDSGRPGKALWLATGMILRRSKGAVVGQDLPAMLRTRPQHCV